jgi:SAM-dependent methyltransferase
MDPNGTNADQIAFWNGPAGQRWVREQALLDRAFAQFTARLLADAALGPGRRVLDVGCGCGTTTLAASETVGAAGFVVGIDVSAQMLEHARRRSAQRTNIQYIQADAAAHRFDTQFDVAISRFGVMFFRDPTAAFANLRSALRPGGKIAFMCWRPVVDNAWAHVPYEIATRSVTPDPKPGSDEPGPFSLGDRARTERILQGAGFFSGVSISPFDADVILSEEGLPAAVEFAMTNGPTGRLLSDSPEDAKARVREGLEAKLRTFAQGGRVAMRGATWIVSATSQT